MRLRTFVAATGAVALLLVGCNQQNAGTPGGKGEPAETISSEGGTQAHNNQAASGPSQQLHDLMMRPMQNMQTTGNVDRDFAAMMAEHHQQAIDMAKIELEHSKNDHMKQMAQMMLDGQTAEHVKLLQIARSESAGGGNMDGSNQLHVVMMRPMQSMTVTSDVDRDFASMMAEHHKGAIDMAKIEIQHGKNAELKKMAQKMLEDQTKEREMLLMHAKGG